jgi:hypothetical protein
VAPVTNTEQDGMLEGTLTDTRAYATAPRVDAAFRRSAATNGARWNNVRCYADVIS